jgi:hypothetical protein
MSLLIALIVSTWSLKLIFDMKQKHSTQVSSVNANKNSTNTQNNYKMQVKLTINSIMVLCTLLLYDVGVAVEMIDNTVLDIVFYYISDFFAWNNVVILVVSSKQVRIILGCGF